MSCFNQIKIKSLSRRKCLTPVFNIAVQEDESYVANDIVVHNCLSILVPITKFEDYKADKPIPVEKLKEWGAGLILPDSK